MTIWLLVACLALLALVLLHPVARFVAVLGIAWIYIGIIIALTQIVRGMAWCLHQIARRA